MLHLLGLSLAAGVPGSAVWGQQANTLAVARAARDAQADFEWARRRNLPFTFGSSSGPCDAQIGRFCYWDDEDDLYSAPEEPARIRRARGRLLSALDSAAAALPGDGWIAGQRVRYLIEARRPAAALGAARACRAERWWCAALVGFAFHTAGDFVRADSAYGAALRAMSPAERCRWTDLSLLLEGELRKRYRRLGCAERHSFEARFWWLAKPLFSRAANDLRTEHLARLTMTRMLERARSAHGVPWGKDLHELVVRYGWPRRWSRVHRPTSVASGDEVLGHDQTPSFFFLPSRRAVDDPASSRESDWTLDPERARARYAPAYATSFTSLPHRIATFDRGDSITVVAAYDLTGDTLFDRLPLEAALVLAADERTPSTIRRRLRSGATGVLVASAPRRPLLLSLEVVAKERRVARARLGVRPRDRANGRVALSDLLLFHPPDSLPNDLLAVTRYTRTSDRARPGEKIGLFWELHGLASTGEPVTVSVSLVKEGTGLLRRIAEALGRARSQAVVRMRWRELARSEGGVYGRAVAVHLPDLSRGRYRIELAVGVAGQPPVTASQRIEVLTP